MNRPRLMARASAPALGLALSLAAAGGALAQQSGASPNEVVVVGRQEATAPAAPPIDTPFAESTITADQIRNLSTAPTVNLQTVLQNQPSVFAYANGPLGLGVNIFVRGFNSGQFAETIQGATLNDIFNGGVTGEADTVNNVLLIPANIDSVELYHGINNPAVNSYNSLGGTINFLPRLPTGDFGGEVGASYGSFNSWEAHGVLNTGDIDGSRQLLAISHAESDGWVANTPAQNTNIYYSGTYDAPSGDHVGLVMVYNDNIGRTPMQMPVPLLQQNGGYWQWPASVAYEADRDQRFMAILDFNAPLSHAVTLDNKVFGGVNNYVRTSYANPADYESKTQPYELYNQGASYNYWSGPGGYPAGPSYDPAPYGSALEYGTDYHFYGYGAWGVGYSPTVTAALPHNTITVGGNVTYGQLHSREYWYGSYDMPITPGYNDAWDEHDTRLLASGYIQDDIKLFNDMLTITPGVKYIWADTTDNDSIGIYYPYGGSPSDTEHFISPTIGLNFQPTRNLSFSFAFGENIKFPDISAFYDEVPGNPAPTGSAPYTPPPVTIKPEHVNDYELGAKYQMGSLSAALNLYREDFSDIFIDAFDPTTFLTVVSNGGTARYQGVELSLIDEFSLGQWGDLKGYVNYAYNQAKFTSAFTADSVGGSLSEAGATVTPGEKMGDVPDMVAAVGATWLWDGWRFNAQGRYIGRQQTLDYNTGVPDGVAIGGYMVADLGLSKTIKLQAPSMFAKNVVIGVNVDNLFNKYYFNYADTSTSENYFQNLTEFASPGAPRSVTGRIAIDF